MTTQHIQAISALGDLKVWSLIVTVLGDRALDGRFIPSAEIAGVLAPLGVKPDALRVALHRLKRDEWVVGRRVGRTSEYALSTTGIATSRLAAARIYATAPASADWSLIICATPEQRERLGARHGSARITQDVYLVPNMPPCGASLVAQATWPLPGWVISEIVQPDVWLGYQRLSGAIKTVLRDLPTEEPIRAALRIVALHQWRRLMLRHPDIPDAALGMDWPGADCRAAMGDLLSAIPRPKQS